jgi:uncharacterized membrane protein
MQTLLILYLVGGTLLIILAIPLLRQRVGQNPVYGFRVPATFRDPQVWFAANRYSAKWLIITGVATDLSALIFYFIPGISLDAYALLCLAVFAVVFGLAIFMSFRYLREVQCTSA